MSDRVAVMDLGHIVALDAPENLKRPIGLSAARVYLLLTRMMVVFGWLFR